MNKQEVINCNDGQALADEVALVCMYWTNFDPKQPHKWYSKFRDGCYAAEDWQPHLTSHIGQSQCFDLAQKYNLELDFVLNAARYDDKENELTYEVNGENMQITILKACLLSQLGEGDGYEIR